MLNIFPKFKVVEINNVASLRMGHMLAQTPAYVTSESGIPTVASKQIALENGGVAYAVENGIIVGLDEKGVLANFDASKHAQPCLVYTEELITFNYLSGLDQFAVLADSADAPVYVRALPLNIGDTFTTNNYTGTLQDGFGKVTNGVIEIEASKSEDSLFIVKKTNLPAGQDAIECMYIGLAMKTVEAAA